MVSHYPAQEQQSHPKIYLKSTYKSTILKIQIFGSKGAHYRENKTLADQRTRSSGISYN